MPDRSQNIDLENLLSADSCDPDRRLVPEFALLWAEAQELWEQNHGNDAYQGYVSADFLAIYDLLARLRNRAFTFLEWGSGLGVITIMASRMGFDAYGIEAEEELVDHARGFAKKYGPDAQFAHGSFIPNDFEWDPDKADVHRTAVDLAGGYDDLDMEIRDFDLVYAFPWPTEHPLFHKIMQDYCRDGALFLTFDANEGPHLVTIDG